MTTITVDINEEQLMNYLLVSDFLAKNSKIKDLEEIKKVTDKHSFYLYKQRKIGDKVVTIQIPLFEYLIYQDLNLIIT